MPIIITMPNNTLPPNAKCLPEEKHVFTSLAVAPSIIEAPAPSTTSASSPSASGRNYISDSSGSHHAEAWSVLKRKVICTFHQNWAENFIDTPVNHHIFLN